MAFDPTADDGEDRIAPVALYDRENGLPLGTAGNPIAVTGGSSGGLTDAELRASPVAVVDVALAGYVDGLEALATTLNGYADGLEGLVTSTNALLTTQAGYVDGLETLATAMNGYVDGLEGLDAAISDKLPAALAANGGLKVEGVAGGVAIPISGSVSVSNFPGSQAVTGTFWQAIQPISGAVSISGSAAVTGTFWQATQPISIAATVAISAAALPLPSGAATETTLAALNTKHPSQGQATMAASVPVVLASNQSALSVTGTFWQATQPVSGTVTANAGTGTMAVSGTFWQATQPVSGTVTANAGSGTMAVSGTFWQATQPVSGTVTANLGTIAGVATETSLAAAAASLSVLDDWDESDRAKANIIVGQAGVDGGSGSVTAKTQRVTQAGFEYETVAASQTAQVLGATGATGDFLSHVIFQPTTTAAGTCTILDNATVIFTFTTGTLSDLRPITVPINAISVSGAWKITTGANVTATGFGDFT